MEPPEKLKNFKGKGYADCAQTRAGIIGQRIVSVLISPQRAPRFTKKNGKNGPGDLTGSFLPAFSSAFHKEVVSSTGSSHIRKDFLLLRATFYSRVIPAKT
jgi:hypothetical protein